ncbi:Spc97/Spc98, partial [Corchorus capsularis]
MAVETNFASLFEKLKVGDPWLPPRTWESIPSQSGPPTPPASHTHISSSSSVSESSLVRLALNALQGVESSLISIEKLSAAFCSDPADRTFHQTPSLWNRSSSTHALGNILKSIGRLGFLVFLLNKFVDYFKNLNLNGKSYPLGKSHGNSQAAGNQNYGGHEMQEKDGPRYSLVNQAFSVAVGKVLQGYICALDSLYASVNLRRSSENVEVSSGCLTSVVYSEVTLLEVYLHTKELRTQIEALGNICNLHDLALCFFEFSFEELTYKATMEFHNFYRGADLLSYLYRQLKVVDPAHSALLKFLFLRSCEPYCEFIRSWIFKAEINDPYKEFVVEYIDKLQQYSFGKVGISIDFPVASIKRDGVGVPCFLKDVLIPLVRAGQQLQVLMKLLEFRKYVDCGDHTYSDFLPCWSGFAGSHSFYASSITFGKENIEALVLRRNSYYERIQEKLETFLTGLEFSYQQVIFHGAESLFVGNGGGSVNTAASLTVDDKLVVTSTAQQSVSNVDSHMLTLIDRLQVSIAFERAVLLLGATSKERLLMIMHSSTKDGSCYSDIFESSSVSSLEEQIETEQLIEHHNDSVWPKQNYFSALSFSISTATDNSFQHTLQNENSYNMESGSQEFSEGRHGPANFIGPESNGIMYDHKSAHLESNCLCAEAEFADILPYKGWPIDSARGNAFYIDAGFRHANRLHVSGSDKKMIAGHMQFPDKVVQDFNESIACGDTSIMDTTNEDELEKNYTSQLFHLQPPKLGYNGSLLSKNPMLSKNVIFRMMSMPSDSSCMKYQKSLPCFDFSSVNDPCKVYIKRLNAGLTHELPESTSSSLINVNKQSYGGDVLLVDNAKVSHAAPPTFELKNQNQDIIPTVSGGRYWQSLLGCSSTPNISGIGDVKLNKSSMFEIPLDFVIDKCLLQEILLQYNYVSKLTIKFLEEGFDLQEHLLALRRYHFMELADWADLFIMSLSRHKWCITEVDRRLSEIQTLLELSVQRSSCEKDHHKDRLVVYAKGRGLMPLSTSTIGVHSFDFLGLGYRVDWPVSLILTPGALKIYADIFNFLIQLKLAVFSLTDVWCSLKVKDIMDLESVHMAYLTDSLHICFLSDETQPVASIIENILQCALDFRSCIAGGIWNVGLAECDLLEKISRINISQ